MQKKYLYMFLVFYLLLHLAKFEVFPLYHFGMYSDHVEFKETPFVSYEVYVDEVKQNFKEQDYRKHTYLMNSIEKYDEVSMNEKLDADANIVIKYLNFLGINKDKHVLQTYTYPELKTDMHHWIKRYLKCRKTQNVVIEKSIYSFDANQTIKLEYKKIILP